MKKEKELLDIDALIADAIGGNDTQQEVTIWLDTGYPPLNKAISGDYAKGLPCGRMIEIYGPPSSGKTAIATKAMAAAQKAGGIAVFMDHENSFDIGLAQDLGLDPTTRWVYKQPETFEEAIDMAVHLADAIRSKRAIPKEAPLVIVFDSLASMVPRSKMFDSKGNRKSSSDYSMHDNMALAKATSATFPALSQMASKYNMCLIFLNQVRTKPGIAYGNPETTPGGAAPEFYASVRIALTREIIRSTDKKEVLGQTINAYIKKNKVGKPFHRAAWNFMFRADGTGFFDVSGSIVTMLKDKGVLIKDGNGVKWTDGVKYMLPALNAKIEKENLHQELFDLMVSAEGIAIPKKDVTDAEPDFEGDSAD